MVARTTPLLLAFAMAACSHGASTPGGTPPRGTPTLAGLAGSEWMLVELPGTTLLAGASPTLVFPEAGRVAGSGSCNRFTGPVSLENGALKMGPLASTMMACPQPVMDQERKYFAELNGADRLAMDGEVLLVYSKGSEKPLRFTRTK